MRKNWWKKAAGMGLALAMAMGLSGCGGGIKCKQWTGQRGCEPVSGD